MTKHKLNTKFIAIIAVSLMIGGLIGFAAGIQAPETSVAAVQPVQTPDVYDLWQDTNNEREKAGEETLELNETLNRSAAAKCADMVAKHYFDHISPDGTRPESFLPTLHNENLAEGYHTSQQTVDAWMASPSHKAAMLDVTNKQVGYGICRDGSEQYVVQHFIE